MRNGFFSLLVLSLLLVAPVAAVAGSPAHMSTPALLKITPTGDNVHKRVVIPLNKALIIELDTSAREVLVSKPEIVDAVIRGPRRIYLMAQQAGQTNAFFFDAAGRQLLMLDIRVDKDADDLADTLQRELPGAHITVGVNNGSVLLSGDVVDAQQALRAQTLASQAAGEGKVLNQLKIGGVDQVMLQVRIAEVSRSVTKQLGIDLSKASASMAVPGGSGNIATTIASAVSPTTGLAISATTSNFGATFQALESLGLIHSLAEPNLVAISGETANFLAGGEFPVASGRDTSGNVSVTFKQYGVGLSFTPVVLGPGRISLKLSTEVSQLSDTGSLTTTTSSTASCTSTSSSSCTTSASTTIPALTVRRAETTIELPSGGSFAIAGLMQHSTTQNINGVPGLKDLPVLGALFRSRDFENDETELVVMVTAYLVNPVQQARLAAPTDGLVTPSDAETLLLERLNHTYPLKKPQDDSDPKASPSKADDPPAKPKGDVGYIVP